MRDPVSRLIIPPIGSRDGAPPHPTTYTEETGKNQPDDRLVTPRHRSHSCESLMLHARMLSR